MTGSRGLDDIAGQDMAGTRSLVHPASLRWSGGLDGDLATLRARRIERCWTGYDACSLDRRLGR
jgi:hypothetical protein